VLKALQDVFHMCQLLCRLFKQLDSESIQAPEFQAEFAHIKANFEKQSNIVFRHLSSFKNYQAQQSSPYLAQLLLRLDFNKYMTGMSEKIEHEHN
jgi:gamma-tubulin complex component 4